MDFRLETGYMDGAVMDDVRKLTARLSKDHVIYDRCFERILPHESSERSRDQVLPTASHMASVY